MGGQIVVWTLRGAGLLCVALFFVLMRLPRNRLGGIRFSYTLADDEVWKRVHRKCRWWVLVIGLVCLLWPLSSLHALNVFTPVVLTMAIAFAAHSYVCAKRIYREKFGTTEVVSCGFFKYAPPASAAPDAPDGPET